MIEFSSFRHMGVKVHCILVNTRWLSFQLNIGHHWALGLQDTTEGQARAFGLGPVMLLYIAR